jgi:hypothetical protein
MSLPPGEGIAPMVHFTYAPGSERKPTRAYLAPQRQSLKLDYQGGYANIVIPSVQGHQMVVLEI